MTARAMQALVLAVAAAACSGPTINGAACANDSDCNLFNTQGTCQTTGFCSYPDPTCAGGQRYSPGAGSDLANTCIGGAQPCGEQGQACCAGGTCGPFLACASDGSDGSDCACGGSGQPCCGGSSCSGGLACDGTQTCSNLAFSQVGVGMGHICALAGDQQVYCWGFDQTWNVDVPHQAIPTIATFTPTPTAGLANVVELRAGELHTCAREMDGSLWCWGHDEHGQLGDGTTVSTGSAVSVAGLAGVTLFEAGRYHTCAVGAFQGVQGLWCWGHGGQRTDKPSGANPSLGRLGNGSNADSAVPVAVELPGSGSGSGSGGLAVKVLSVGSQHSCAVLANDTVWCWGRNSSGELGNATTTDTSVPVEVATTGITIPPGVHVVDVSCSDGMNKRGGSTCMLLGNGSAFCWGANSFGELGDGTTTSRTAPSVAVDVSGLGSAKLAHIVSAQSARCGLASDGSVWCWGQNVKGLLGVGLDNAMPGNAAVSLSRPAQVGLTGVTQLDMSHHTACAISATKLFCWGNNERGQIGLRAPASQSETSVLVPTQIVY